MRLMRLTRLNIQNFRNYSNFELNFDPEEFLTCIIGENAQGKTNILEAIYMLAITKSFRANDQKETIQWGKEYAKVQGAFTQTTPEISTVNLEVFRGLPPYPQKILKKNGVQINTEDFIGLCKIVFFHPQNLNMLYLGPDLRRHYIDIINIQISKKFYTSMQKYASVLKQRNCLLKNIKTGKSTAHSLASWDKQLVSHGSFIMTERAKTINFIQKHLQEYYQKIAQNKDIVEVKYLDSITKFYSTKKFSILDHEFLSNAGSCEKVYEQALNQTYALDVESGWTSIGPHRDDIQFKLNGHELSLGASRGEYRSVLLALKLLELKFLEDSTGQKPILLLDDVYSELDTYRQKMLTQAIQDYQSIMTATHLENSPGESRQHRVLEIKKTERANMLTALSL